MAVKSNTHFIIVNDCMCLLGLLGQFLAACDVGCGCVHLGIWLGWTVSVAPSQGWQGPRLAAGSWQLSGAVGWTCIWPVHVWLVLLTAWQLGSQSPRGVSRDCHTSHRLGLESSGLPRKVHLYGPESPLISSASHSVRLHFPGFAVLLPFYWLRF